MANCGATTACMDPDILEMRMEDKLNEILKQFEADLDASENFVYSGDGPREEAKAALKKLVLECVPEERNVAPRWDQSKASWDQLLCDIWNDSRTQMLQAIEERFK